MKLRVLDLFSGIGGFSLGLERTGGFQTVAFCEIEPACRKILAKHWPETPIYEDVRTLSATRLAADGIGVDIICGGFPCQDISIAGLRKGLEGERSGLWSEIARLTGELLPRFVLVENVSGLLSGPDEQPGQWFGRILGDLASLGYDAEWHCISASAVGAAHVRDRVWIIAYPQCEGRQGSVADNGTFERQTTPFAIHSNATDREWIALVRGEFGLRDGDGFPLKLDRDRIKALGNAVVPQIPELIGHAVLTSMGARP